MGKYKKIAGIYTIRCAINQKIYVGYSTNIKKRWANHKDRLGSNCHVNRHLQAAWNIYKKPNFIFEIVETLPFDLTKQQYEQVETKWVLFYKSHQSEFGYNSVLPGTVPLHREEENRSIRALKKYVCIKGTEVIRVTGSYAVFELTNISPKIQQDLCSYWAKGGRRKSRWGWIIVKEENYDDTFDYVGYKKKREWLKPKTTKTWKDYKRKEYIKKNQEDIIPYTERNLKRIPIIAVNISTGETISYTSIKDSNNDFLECKVRKCIANEFGKYKHRGYYFKKAK